MPCRPPTFVTNEDGAVTVDWVVLTAALVGLGFVTAQTVLIGTENVAQQVRDQITDITVNNGQ